MATPIINSGAPVPPPPAYSNAIRHPAVSQPSVVKMWIYVLLSFLLIPMIANLIRGFNILRAISGTTISRARYIVPMVLSVMVFAATAGAGTLLGTTSHSSSRASSNSIFNSSGVTGGSGNSSPQPQAEVSSAVPAIQPLPRGESPGSTIRMIEQYRINAYATDDMSQLDLYYLDHSTNNYKLDQRNIVDDHLKGVYSVVKVDNIKTNAAYSQMSADVSLKVGDGSIQTSTVSYIAQDRGDGNGYHWYVVSIVNLFH